MVDADDSEETKPLNVRVPLDVHAGLVAATRLLRMFAKASGEEYSHINLSFTVRRYLRAGNDQTFGDFGVGVPANEADWAKIEQIVGERVAGAQSSGTRPRKHR
jgi:hypothetical protein